MELQKTIADLGENILYLENVLTSLKLLRSQLCAKLHCTFPNEVYVICSRSNKPPGFGVEFWGYFTTREAAEKVLPIVESKSTKQYFVEKFTEMVLPYEISQELTKNGCAYLHDY